MRYLVVCALFALSCGKTNSKPVYLGFSADSSGIVIKNIDRNGLYQLQRDTQALDSMALIDVVETPAADDSLTMEKTVTGRLHLRGDSLLFLPDTPFTRGKTYLVQTFVNSRFAAGGDVLRGKLQPRVKPVAVTLRR
ncbi:hypothetical protein C7T94_01810 [Pedobacter yulinensis]|uniref:Lipoprotein n=1 Tax=Pedobacter yulinensis TaxID=2126353 RepID=A0A2T3HR02_9SPHI|nr:hypothetical protein [Pedobacter yulinensis]PST84885.1 hypothetical protein C7T94_01810 [Pedobacter yulinensis]